MINEFQGEYFFLNNFSEFSFWYNGRQWKTVEHAFQAAKCAKAADCDKIYAVATADEARQIGSTIKPISGWDKKQVEDCLEIISMLNHLAKYSNTELVQIIFKQAPWRMGRNRYDKEITQYSLYSFFKE